MLDTAAAYGESEAILGACGIRHWNVITKFPSLEGVEDASVAARARVSVFRSLELLRTDRLYAVLAHDCRDMAGDRGRRICDTLQPLVLDGVIGKLGASIYEPSELGPLASSGIVQAPLNVFDQRMSASGVLCTLKDRNTELHVRSAFLQGLLLMDHQKRPKRFERWSWLLERYDALVAETGVTSAAFCLGFALQNSQVARAVVGVENASQLADLLAAFALSQRTVIDAQSLSSEDPGLIDPRLWQSNT